MPAIQVYSPSDDKNLRISVLKSNGSKYPYYSITDYDPNSHFSLEPKTYTVWWSRNISHIDANGLEPSQIALLEVVRGTEGSVALYTDPTYLLKEVAEYTRQCGVSMETAVGSVAAIYSGKPKEVTLGDLYIDIYRAVTLKGLRATEVFAETMSNIMRAFGKQITK